MSTLKKELGIKEVFAISSGAMISSGIFVLPAVVYSKAGPSMILSYLIAAILVIPALYSKAELATAMPKSGGTYFFITRSFGALFGTFTGLSNWFSIALKSAFALVGIGIFLEPLVPVYNPYMIKIIAIVCTFIFSILNILSVKESGRSQLIMVGFLMVTFLIYIIFGLPRIHIESYIPFTPYGWRGTFYVTGMIFISFGGLTKIASVAEEIKDPGRSIPVGMFSAFIIVSILYVISILIVTGTVDHNELTKSLFPLSTSARTFLGTPGFILLSSAAILAFITTANAGLMAASRSPLAMARDNLIPEYVGHVHSKLKTPVLSIILTSLFMSFCILFLDMENLVKIASAMMLVLFALENLSVIMMRQSGIISYRPVFRSPLYPFFQIAGIIVYLILIIQMGMVPILFMTVLFVLSLLWYVVYGKKRVENRSAFLHLVEDLAKADMQDTEDGLTDELISILRERDDIEEDRFDALIRNSRILDMDSTCTRDELFSALSTVISERWKIDAESIRKKLIIREEEASTLIYPGVAVPHAIPHIIMEGQSTFDIIPVRNRFGIKWNDKGDIVYTAFCLIGSKDERNFHLKALMSIAQILQDPDFHGQWIKAKNNQELRSVLLLTSRKRHLN